MSKFVYVCGKHFVTGFHSKNSEHPDYVPSIFPNRRILTDGTVKLRRFKNACKREIEKVGKRRESEAFEAPTTKSCVSAPVEAPTLESCVSAPVEAPTPESCVSAPGEAPTPDPPNPDSCPPTPVSNEEAVARPLSYSEKLAVAFEVAHLRRERDEARQERDEARRGHATAQANWSKDRLCANAIRGSDTACRAMTGLSWAVFDTLHKFLVQFVNTSRKTDPLSTEDQLFLCLLKIRQNPSLALLSQVLNKPKSTVSYYFHRWLDLLYAKIGFLIHWPDRECIYQAVPPVMRAKFPRLTSIIDCFEIRIEHPKALKARAKSYSNYKKWTTAKYLICCSPAGSITYLSKAWGGRASDVKIVRESGFLSPIYHHRGDQILADRGFTLKDDFALLGASLLTPAFTKGKKQLPGKDVEESRIKSSVRIHIGKFIYFPQTGKLFDQFET
ncbi:hypothetical protein N1851_007076 [Merluccius polli]|uniref:DDE Tnp4 domain-containing protein n=1 Tax=Merluccius polli TaxID=89951 RepID=A0AA47N3B7_MERPO|nr:hypothetical protein N1851_007076 [Merluccius polli]